MDAKINLVYTPWLLLLEHVRLMLIIEEFYNGHPGVAIIHVVPKPRSIDHGKADYHLVRNGKPQYYPDIAYGSRQTFEEFFFQLSFSDLYLHGLVYLLRMTASMIRIVFDSRGEECIDKSCLS